MITANTKITAKEVLKEVGILDTSVFGTMRVRIGGIAGINDPDRVINIAPTAKTLEVIVGNDLYELELAKGTKENNADVATVTSEAKAVIEDKGRDSSKKAEHLQKVRDLSRKIRESKQASKKYQPNKDEERIFTEAAEKADLDLANLESQTKLGLKPIKVKSK